MNGFWAHGSQGIGGAGNWFNGLMYAFVPVLGMLGAMGHSFLPEAWRLLKRSFFNHLYATRTIEYQQHDSGASWMRPPEDEDKNKLLQKVRADRGAESGSDGVTLIQCLMSGLVD